MHRGVYRIVITGRDAARFKRLLAVSAPSAGGEYLSEKFNEFVEAARVEVRLDKDSIRLTEGGNVAADLTISEAGVAVKYNVYLRKDHILLQFVSTDRSRVELAAILLRHAGVTAEVSKVGDRGVWRVIATTRKLAAGREELRNALAEIVRRAVERGWVNADTAERWLEELEEGRVLKESWPEYEVRLVKGALRVRYRSTDPDSIKQTAQRFRDMGLEEGKHFSVKMPEEDSYGYISILREGLAYAARLSVYGKDEQQRRLAAKLVEHILKRAEEEGKEVYEKATKIVEEGMSMGSLTLEGFERVVEVNGEKYKVKVIDGEAVEEDRNGRKLLRIKITAEVGGVKREYVITYGRNRASNEAKGYAYASAKAPGGREADAERFSALVKALTGKEPWVYRRSDGTIKMVCGREHLDGFMRFAELADTIEKWLERDD